MKFLHVLKWASMAIGALLLASIVYPFLMEAIGFYTLNPGWAVAKQLVNEGKDARECRKILRGFWWDVLSPPTAEQRANCIFDYAKLKQDPSACELLMPSEYGLSCINNVISQQYKDDLDSGFFDFNECKKTQTAPLREDWCNFVRAHKSRNAADCAPIHNDVIRTGCVLKFGAWEKYPQLRGSFYFGASASSAR